MSARMVADHRRYTKAEKDAYRARELKRRYGRAWRSTVAFIEFAESLGRPLGPWQQHVAHHYFGDNKGHRVPTIVPRNGVL